MRNCSMYEVVVEEALKVDSSVRLPGAAELYCG